MIDDRQLLRLSRNLIAAIAALMGFWLIITSLRSMGSIISFFGGRGVKLGVFLPAAVILLGLWISGVYLWLLPYAVKRRRRDSTP